MKKLIAVLTGIIILLVFSGCAAADNKFFDMRKVLPSSDYERCVYSIEIKNYDTGDVYTDASSEMVLTFEKLDGTLAGITAESSIKFTSTPPYANQTYDYSGLTDTMSSEVTFNGYSDDFNPVSVKKSADLQTSRKFDPSDKSFTAELTYPAGKASGKGKQTVAASGEEKTFEIKSGKLKNTFDNEQLYYMVSSLLSKETGSDLKTKLGYSQQYKVFNLADYLSYGYTGDNLTFTVAEDTVTEYNSLNVPNKDKLSAADKDKMFAQVGVSFPKGRPLIMYYSLDDIIEIGDNAVSNTHIRPYLLLGYYQDTLLGDSTTRTSFTLKEYSAKKS